MLQKAKINCTVGAGAMETLINDTTTVLGELKLLIESCLQPVRLGKHSLEADGRKRAKKNVFGDFVKIDQMLSMALCLDTHQNTVWKKRDSEDIFYANPLLNTEYLFPARLEPLDDDEAAEVAQRIKSELDDDVDEDEDDKEGDDEDELDDGARDEVGSDDPDFRPKRKSAGTTRSPRSARKRKTMSAKKLLGKKSGQYECGKCGKKYISATSLYSHMEKKCAALKEIKAEFTETDGSFFCSYPECIQGDDGFATKEELDIHWADDHIPDEEKFIPCVLCDKKFATPAAKKAHLKMKHVKPFKCPKCDRSFAQKENLQYHLTNHTDIASGSNEDNGEEGSAKKRIKVKEESKERHLCLKCGQTVAMSHGKKHEARCTGMHVRHPEYKKLNDEFFCTVEGCNIGYGFNSVYGLRKHFHGCHVREEEKYFACDYCDERFSFLTTKNKHMKMKHIKPHICDICGKGFGFKNKLTDHRLIHTGEKPYACDKCEYRASKKGNLDAHKIDKHGDFGGNKNYICAMCNKQFTTMGRVRRHMETMHVEGKEESARHRRQRQKLAMAQAQQQQQTAIQHQQQQQQQARFKREISDRSPNVVHMVQQQVPTQQVVQQQQQHLQPEEQDAAVQFLENHLDRDLYH